MFDSGLSYIAINTARSALSALSSAKKADYTIGSHPTVVRFMKGIFELKTPTPRYNLTLGCVPCVNISKNAGR
jgi:hypothetical protein